MTSTIFTEKVYRNQDVSHRRPEAKYESRPLTNPTQRMGDLRDLAAQRHARPSLSQELISQIHLDLNTGDQGLKLFSEVQDKEVNASPHLNAVTSTAGASPDTARGSEARDREIPALNVRKSRMAVPSAGCGQKRLLASRGSGIQEPLPLGWN
jgi:hypothetical protein